MMEGTEREEHHDEMMEQHEHMKPELHAFHEVLAPVWHSQAGDVRIAKACDNAAAFRDKAAATGDAALVDAAAQLATACASKGPPVEAALQKMHERFHALAEMH